MKNKNIGIIVVLVALVIIFITMKVSRKEEVSNNTGEVRDLCYIWNTEAGDKATLEMYIKDGTEVTGSFNFLPAQKDKKTGPIAGTAGPVDQMSMSRKADLIWTASAEGVTNKEQLFVRFGEGTAQAGFGAMRENAEGVWVYADPENLSYAPTLQQTSCDDAAL